MMDKGWSEANDVMKPHDVAKGETNFATLNTNGTGAFMLVSRSVDEKTILESNPNYWGKNINVNIGRYNFDTIHTDYYRDETVAIEAFKSGAYDFKIENSSKNWATSYKFKAVDRKQVITEEIKYFRPSGMQGFAFNIRNPFFKNRNVRKKMWGTLFLIMVDEKKV